MIMKINLKMSENSVLMPVSIRKDGNAFVSHKMGVTW